LVSLGKKKIKKKFGGKERGDVNQTTRDPWGKRTKGNLEKRKGSEKNGDEKAHEK